MAKYYGKIGYLCKSKETEPGIWKEKLVEEEIFGDIIRITKRTDNQGQYNDSVNINNQISFVANPYIAHNFQSIKYVTWMGSKWAISSVEVAYPRLILNLGGLYHESNECN